MRKKITKSLVLELSEKEAEAIAEALYNGEYAVDVNSEAREHIVEAKKIIDEFLNG